jgi:hypothetical protein
MIPGTTNREMEEKRENPNIEPKLAGTDHKPGR